MSTDKNEVTAAPVPADDAARRAWFARFGYAGDLDETVTLRSSNDRPLGTATVADVWAVLTGLRRMEGELNGLFRRAILAAGENMRPIDHVRRLSEIESGALTDEATGEFRPGRLEIIRALLDINTDTALGDWVDAPLVPSQQTAAHAA